MTDSPANILRRAKAKIEDPAHWCQNNAALNHSGRAVLAEDDRAQAWCSWGAVTAVSRFRGGPAHDFLDQAASELGCRCTAELNDHNDHPTVMKMFDRAIALAEQSGEGE